MDYQPLIIDAITYSTKALGYMSVFILAVNIIGLLFCSKLLNTPSTTINVEYTHCTQGKCKNKSFKGTAYCYWHNPLRQLLVPIGSELTPRRSIRVALKNQGMYVVFPPESKIE
jgi:hypothetical protein